MIYLIAGARPNFMKIAPIVRALHNHSDRFEYRIIHTGQHYDRDMSDVFLEELGIPKPDHHLECGGGSHAEQTAKIMVAFEHICQKNRLAQADCTRFKSTQLKDQHSDYGIIMLHRPSNVDDPDVMAAILGSLNTLSERLPLIFPVHPRTKSNLQRFGLIPASGITLTGPLSYMDFLNLWKDAKLVLTDSGGLQEETTALGVPCLTLRHNTERPITVDEGTNVLLGTEPSAILREAYNILDGGGKTGKRPPLWDGRAAERYVPQHGHPKAGDVYRFSLRHREYYRLRAGLHWARFLPRR